MGLNDPIAPVGNPLTVNVTVPVNPPDGVTVAVYEVPAPAVTVLELGEAVTLKSPLPAACTTRVTPTLWTSAPLVAVTVSG
jgi:hypothetical protein